MDQQCRRSDTVTANTTVPLWAYLTEGRALRIEQVINSPTDLGVNRRLQHLHELQAKARAANRRLLDTERAGQGCVLASPAFARVAQPSGEAGYPTGVLRFGDPRVMALAGALCLLLTSVVGSPTGAFAPR